MRRWMSIEGIVGRVTWKSKARDISACMKILRDKYDGQILRDNI